jgi:large subunit ribosomal protein L6e
LTAFLSLTTAQADVSKVALPADVNDAMFARPASAKKAGFFADGEEPKKGPSPARAAAQKAVDAGVEAAVNAVPQLKEYLRTLFTLRKGQFPHEMTF